MTTTDTVCPVCLRSDATRHEVKSAVPLANTKENCDDGFCINCSACGEFVVTHMDDVNLKSPRLRSKWNPAHLSALLREQAIRPLPKFWLQYAMAPYGPLERTDLAPIDLDELLTRWPRTVPERIDRTLCNLARLSPTGGHRMGLDPKDTAMFFAVTEEEAMFHIDALKHYGLLDGDDFGISHSPSNSTLTADGWARFEELTSGASAPENPVFVAMWFGGTEEEKLKMSEAFHKAIHPAVEQAGYRATRVDLAEHNDWIMDKVLGDIRLAPFVVADFTGNRNGVYLEAGFARGLGIPVIHTCREDDFKNAHFDTQQLNHVLWKTPEELRTKLYHRIVGTIGQGPHPRPTTRA